MPTASELRHWRQLANEPLTFSSETQLKLQVLNWEERVQKDPEGILEEVCGAIHSTNDTYEAVAPVADIAHSVADRKASQQQADALTFYWMAARYAAMYMFDERTQEVRNPYSPTFANMSRIYNDSVEKILRYLSKDGALPMFDESVTLELKDGPCRVPVRMISRHWKLSDIYEYHFVADFEVTGLNKHHRERGLGVPLIAEYQLGDQQNDATFLYCLKDDDLAMTAFLHFQPDGSAALELYDPMDSMYMTAEGKKVPLEIDYTTPLACNIQQRNKTFKELAHVGFLQPDKMRNATEDSHSIEGIYMSAPYDPEKIPVIFVHGLYSSPMTWMEMYNTLMTIKDIREHYQFWFYFYPNGQPFWVSATQFREELAQLRQDIDPTHRHKNLDRMVLIGHSMGGLLSTLQTIDSGENIWNLICDVPVEETQCSEETKESLQKWFHYTPNPSIACVITIGTPFHGSNMANSTTGSIPKLFGDLASAVVNSRNDFVQSNQDVLKDRTMLDCHSSIDSLRCDDPFWNGLMASKPSPNVRYFNIIGVGPKSSKQEPTDGLVTAKSASIPWCSNPSIVPAMHTQLTQHGKTAVDVSTILYELLESCRRAANSQSGMAAIHSAGSPDAVPAVGAQSVPTLGSQSVPTSGVQSAPMAGVPSVPSLGSSSVPTSGVQSAPMAGVQPVPAGGSSSVPTSGVQFAPMAGVQPVPAGGSQSVPTSGVQSAPMAGAQSVPAGGSQSVPTSGVQFALMAGVQPVPAGGSSSVPPIGTPVSPTVGSPVVSVAPRAGNGAGASAQSASPLSQYAPVTSTAPQAASVSGFSTQPLHEKW